MDERQKPRTGVQGFLGCPKVDLAARVLGVVGLTADFPEVSVEGFLTSCRVLLGLEGLLVGTDRGEVNRAICNGCLHRCEAGTCRDLLGGQSSRTFGLLAEVQTVTLIAFGGCYAVGAEEHFGARMLTVLARFTECAGYRVDTGTPFYFCHSRVAILVHVPKIHFGREYSDAPALQSDSRSPPEGMPSKPRERI